MSAPDLFHIAFYRFVDIVDPPAMAAALREITGNLLGTVLVAAEGINGTLAGTAAALDSFEHALRNAPALEGLFESVRCLRTACRTPPFQRLKVHVRSEVLPLGVVGVDPVGRRGRQLDAAQWKALLATGDAVVIDNRNHFEYRLGHFRDAVDPQVGNFRDLPRYIEAHAADWKAQGRQVAMYCTGGIRCEKTAVWMQDAFGLEVLQLEGGILRYLAESGDADAGAEADWQGECFVFDNRIALDAALAETQTTAADVYADEGDEAWRLRRATRLGEPPP
jgi:UPF0176 protein